MNATEIQSIIDIDIAFEIFVIEEMLATPAMEADADTFAFAYRYYY